jgi:hypothetical protein
VKGKDYVPRSGVEQVNNGSRAHREPHMHGRFNTRNDHDIAIAGHREMTRLTCFRRYSLHQGSGNSKQVL